MSNQLVGAVYKRIIDEVINASHVTFEEDGVEQQTLEDVRSKWQQSLTGFHVASLPWDPQPAPKPMVEPSPIPSNAPSLPRPGSAVSSTPLVATVSAPTIVDGVRIKSEPNTIYDLTNLTQGNGLPIYNGQAAQQRAAQQLQQRFGAQANAQINQLQQQAAAMGGAGQHVQSRSVQQGSRTPTPMSEQQKHQYAEHQRYVQEQQRLQILQAQRASVSNAQTDGAGDWNTMVTERRAAAKKALVGLGDADLTIMQQLQQSNNAMEGGGLLLPLSEQPILPRNPKKYKTTTSGLPNSSRLQMTTTSPTYPLAVPQSTKSTTLALDVSQSAHVAGVTGQVKFPPKISQFDGGNDSDEDNKTRIKDDPDTDDEDAINSDLDDSDEENHIEDNEDANADGKRGELMLCTYDKVQRVKNKWKCTLKDGVLATGGKEYVFHKGQGEFEW